MIEIVAACAVFLVGGALVNGFTNTRDWTDSDQGIFVVLWPVTVPCYLVVRLLICASAISQWVFSRKSDFPSARVHKD